MQKRKKKGKVPPFFAFFSLCVFLSFLLLEKKKMPKEKALEMKGQKQEARSRSQK
jgi:hypothetical protein